MRIFLLFIFVVCNCIFASSQIPDSTKADGKKLIFSDGTSFETPLYHLKVIGYLTNNGKTAFYILSGRDCNNCNAPDELFIHNPADGEIHFENTSNRFPYPGTLYSRRDSMKIYEGRTFFGMVLFNKTNALIAYQKVKMADGKMYDNILLIEIVNGKLRSTIQPPDSAKISETLKLLELGKCKEIEGKLYLSER